MNANTFMSKDCDSPEIFMKKDVTVNEDQKRFVIPCGGGYTCFGFENARRDTAAIASKLKRDDLTPLESEFGTLAGYAKYLRACDAWSQSVGPLLWHG